MSRHLAVIGIVISAVYLALVVFLVGGRLSALQTMELNAIGDFFAGIFGPLSILWLVLGFFQQGTELRQNNEALNLQARELKSSVAQQREMVGIAGRQLAAELDAAQEDRRQRLAALEPIFAFSKFTCRHISSGVFYFEGEVVNAGNKVVDVSIGVDDDKIIISNKNIHSLLHGDGIDLKFRTHFPKDAKTFGMHFSYRIDNGSLRGKSFLLVPTYNDKNELDGFERTEVL